MSSTRYALNTIISYREINDDLQCSLSSHLELARPTLYTVE